MPNIEKTVKLFYNDQLAEICARQEFIVVKKDIDLVSEEEYAQIRMDWFGASDSSRLLDVNPFPKGTFEDLIHEKLTNEVDESIGKKASVRMGKDIEDLIMEKCKLPFKNSVYHPIHIFKPTYMYGNLKNHLGCNFDGVALIPDNKAFPIEIKAVTKYGRKYYDFTKSKYYQKDGEWQEPREFFGEFEGDTIEDRAHSIGIPVYYYTQLQQQMMLLNSPIGFLAAMDVDNWDVHIFIVLKDSSVWEELKQRSLLGWTRISTTRKIKEEKMKKDLS